MLLPGQRHAPRTPGSSVQASQLYSYIANMSGAASPVSATENLCVTCCVAAAAGKVAVLCSAHVSHQLWCGHRSPGWWRLTCMAGPHADTGSVRVFCELGAKPLCLCWSHVSCACAGTSIRQPHGHALDRPLTGAATGCCSGSSRLQLLQPYTTAHCCFCCQQGGLRHCFRRLKRSRAPGASAEGLAEPYTPSCSQPATE